MYFFPNSTSFAYSSLLLLYMLFCECHWPTIISESQINKMSHSETFLFMQNIGASSQCLERAIR